MPALYAFDATTKYVDAINGNDANSGDSEDEAYQTLGHAKDEAPNWSTIFVAPGDYNETNLFGNFTWVFAPGAIVVYNGVGPSYLFDGTDNGFGGTGTCRVLGHGEFHSTTGIIALSYINSSIEIEADLITSGAPTITFPFAENNCRVHINAKNVSSSNSFIYDGLIQFGSVATVTGKIEGFTGLGSTGFISVATGATVNIDLEIGNVRLDTESSAISFSGGTCLMRNGSIKSTNGSCFSNLGSTTDSQIIMQGVALFPGNGILSDGDTNNIFLDSTCIFDKANTQGGITFGAFGLVPGIHEPCTYYVDSVNGKTYNSGKSRGAAKQLLSEAKQFAQEGDTIIVMSGLYEEKNLAKNGVNWHFERGARVVVNEESDTAVWDDGPNGTNSAVSFKVTGHGTFGSDWSEGGMSMVNLVKDGSRVSIQCDRLTSIGKLITLNTNAHLTLDVDYMHSLQNGEIITVDSGAQLHGKVKTLVQDSSVIPGVSISVEGGSIMSLEFDYYQSSALMFFDVNGESYLRLQNGLIRHVNGESLEPHGVTAIEASDAGRVDLNSVSFLIGPEDEGLPRFELVNVPGEDSVINVDTACRIDHLRTSGKINYGDASVLALNNHTTIDGYTVAQAMAILMAVAAGKVDGSGSNTTTLRSLDDERDRIIADVDVVGNRTDITIDVGDLT